MITGLKVSSFASKYVFYQNTMQKGDSTKLNFEGLEMQK